MLEMEELKKIAERYRDTEVRIFPHLPELTPVEAVLRCAEEAGFQIVRQNEKLKSQPPPSPLFREHAHERYFRDPVFHTLVQMLYVQIDQSHYTPTELREACHLAACMFEERRIRPALIDPREPFKWNTKT